MKLPGALDPTYFDDVYRLDAATWRPAVFEICAAHGLRVASFEPAAHGSNLVARVGSVYAKIFPPFHRHQWESEWRTLARLERARLDVAIPELVARGEREDGWTYVIAGEVAGVSVEAAWSELPRGERSSILRSVGSLIASVHALEPAEIADLPPAWEPFLLAQVEGLRSRHERLGMPAWLVDGAARLAGEALADLRGGPRVILTGEYTPFNLLLSRGEGGLRLSGMIDFGDAMIGHPEYDLLGPCLFMAAGDGACVEALFEGYGSPSPRVDGALRARLMALAMLHRYANLRAQLRLPGWLDRVRDIDSLAALVFC